MINEFLVRNLTIDLTVKKRFVDYIISRNDQFAYKILPQYNPTGLLFLIILLLHADETETIDALENTIICEIDKIGSKILEKVVQN